MNNITRKPIYELLGEHFFIPKYQRGYRWTSQQVKELLNDVLEFFKQNENAPKENFYCIQPLVVTKTDDEKWEVIDGQQRLTTIHLILTYLSDLRKLIKVGQYQLSYETRVGSEDFLNNVDEDKATENIDFFYISRAYKAIDEWFNEIEGSYHIDLLRTFTNSDDKGKNVQFIWYEVVDGSDSIDIFTRLNMGKISLTNGELIKALFLRKGNFDTSNEEGVDAMYLKQLQIASEWDKIETTLQNNDFWYFIYDTKNPFKYSTRIEYIFDLMKGRNREHEERYTFLAFDRDFQLVENKRREDNRPHIDKLWLEVKQYFQTLKEWYNRKEWFHLIGFLIVSEVSIKEIKALSIKDGVALRKNEFTVALEKRVRDVVKGYDLDDLHYQTSEMAKIRTILLLFNIETLNQNAASQIRFPFELFKTTSKNDGFDVEHIRSQTDKEISKNDDRKNWIGELLSFYIGLDLSEINNEVIVNLDKKKANKIIIKALYELHQKNDIDEGTFKKIFKKIAEDLNEDENTDVDGLGNLALLNRSINRGYKNIMFPLKRKWLLEEERKGKYIPLCTKNVFMKAYSSKMDSFMYWQNKDAEDYLATIKTTLEKYLH
jgi:hypothetical protein